MATDPIRPEHRWPVVAFTVAAFVIWAMLPQSFSAIPSWVIPLVGAAALVPLVIANPHRLTRETTWSKWFSIGISLAVAVVNQVYIVRIIIALVRNEADGPAVLLIALGVWITNVIAFALVYWELDRGGPVARRVEGVRDDAVQDFRFPQQDGSPGQKGWQSEFFDYVYFSLSTMMAFSPTDVMPLTIRAKALMAYEALTGFVLLALVISRAVNILT